MPPTPADPLLGQPLDGKFLIEKLLGVGGMGRVYKATQLSLDKQVCVKVLHRTMMGDPTLIGRFKREARAASRLNHPNSVTVIDFGQTAEDGSLYLVMEYIPGNDLGKVIREERPFSEQRIVIIMDQVLSALADAHAAGIVHRDLKPENIMVTDLLGTKDFVKVLDFGIAKIQEGAATDPGLTQVGMVCGTPEYMSPEQARGEALDARCDLYSAGVILYQMVTGRLPFSASNAMAVVTKHLTESAVPPRMIEGIRVSSRLEAVILKAMSKDRKGRQPSALALQQELNAVLSPKIAPGEETPLETHLFAMESIEPAVLDHNAPMRFAALSAPRRLSNLKKSSWLWLWVALAIAVTGGGAMAVYHFLRSW
jgi:serine/threonine-protein kinase